jgi:hypothetical protein
MTTATGRSPACRRIGIGVSTGQARNEAEVPTVVRLAGRRVLSRKAPRALAQRKPASGE